MNHQKALWFSALRGAMAFALALQSVHDLPNYDGEIIFTATTAIVVLTILVIGGPTSTMLEKLEVVGEADEKRSYSLITANFSVIDKDFLRPFFAKEDKRRSSADEAPNGLLEMFTWWC